jgi:hypothetical protein
MFRIFVSWKHPNRHVGKKERNKETKKEIRLLLVRIFNPHSKRAYLIPICQVQIHISTKSATFMSANTQSVYSVHLQWENTGQLAVQAKLSTTRIKQQRVVHVCMNHDTALKV